MSTTVMIQGNSMRVLFLIILFAIVLLIGRSKQKKSASQSRGAARWETARRQETPPAGPEDQEIREQLEQLERFLESGLIDREEYRKQKEKIQRGQ